MFGNNESSRVLWSRVFSRVYDDVQALIVLHFCCVDDVDDKRERVEVPRKYELGLADDRLSRSSAAAFLL